VTKIKNKVSYFSTPSTCLHEMQRSTLLATEKSQQNRVVRKQPLFEGPGKVPFQQSDSLSLERTFFQCFTEWMSSIHILFCEFFYFPLDPVPVCGHLGQDAGIIKGSDD
jgi:hypothetical protein